MEGLGSPRWQGRQAGRVRGQPCPGLALWWRAAHLPQAPADCLGPPFPALEALRLGEAGQQQVALQACRGALIVSRVTAAVTHDRPQLYFYPPRPVSPLAFLVGGTFFEKSLACEGTALCRTPLGLELSPALGAEPQVRPRRAPRKDSSCSVFWEKVPRHYPHSPGFCGTCNSSVEVLG